MKLFLDTAHYDDIKKLMEAGIVDGITTNPSHLAQEKEDPLALVKKICTLLGDRPVSVEVTENAPEKVYQQALAIARIAPNVVVKIPCHLSYYGTIKKLAAEGIAINVTLVFTLIQGWCMAKLGVRYISLFIGRWEDSDVEGAHFLAELRNMLDTYEFSTELLAASLRTVCHIHDALNAGAHIATIAPALLTKAVHHPLTKEGMEKFAKDWQALALPHFP